MPCQERTGEFFQIAELIRATKPPKPFPATPPPPRTKSSFSAQSAEIRKLLNATTDELARLAKLASSKSLVDDNTAEIESLSFHVKQDIKQLQARVRQLQSTINERKGGTGENDQVAAHSKAVVGTLQSKLASATNEFKDVLNCRAENMKSAQDRRAQFGGGGGMQFGTPPVGISGAGMSQRGGGGGASMFAQGPTGSNPFQNQSTPLLQLGDLSGGNAAAPDDDDECVISVQSLEQMQMVAPNGYAESRAVAVENIQKTMVELGEVYQQLNSMVASQAEMIETIDNHVDDTVQNVESAQDMWLEYLKNLQSGRMLTIKIFGILLAFALFFLIFLK